MVERVQELTILDIKLPLIRICGSNYARVHVLGIIMTLCNATLEYNYVLVHNMTIVLCFVWYRKLHVLSLTLAFRTLRYVTKRASIVIL